MLPVRLTCLLTTISAILMTTTICLTIYILSRESSKLGSLIIVDTDGGVDDLFAIIMLAKSESLRIGAITTVAGNTGVKNATRNVQTILNMLQLNSVSVYPGNERNDTNVTEGYYGWDGLGDFLPEAPELDENKTLAANILIKIVEQHPGQVTLLCLGPLSNLAEAINIQPDLLRSLRQVIIVGATYNGGGNVGHNMEFNVVSDPEAAAKIFNTTSMERPILLIPEEVINSDAAFPMVWREDRLGVIENEIMDFLNKAENKSLHKDEVWFCYDQSGAAVIISPGMIKNKTTGSIQVDQSGVTTFSPNIGNNVDVVTGLNSHRLQRLIIETFF